MHTPIMRLLTILVGVFIFQSSLAQVREYHLTIDKTAIEIDGKSHLRLSVNGQTPAPTLEFEEGDEAVIHVHNNLNETTSIHWHGILLPGLMDGVPGFNGFNGIAPGGHFEYRFKIRQNGTYWYHAHSRGQEQDGLYGAFIVYPKNKKPLAAHENAQQDLVIMLSEFHPSLSQQIMNNLKKSAEYYQNQRETIPDVMAQMQQQGTLAALKERWHWGQMRMLKTDLSDVTGYTFLINGKTPNQHWSHAFSKNETLRLRFINASAMSFFDVRIPNLTMTVIAADGQPVKPISVDEFRIGTAETYDVLIRPTQDHYQIEAESIDRSGFALGSLHINSQEPQPLIIPAARPRALLTMADMGHGDHADMDHSAMNHADMRHDEIDHSMHSMSDDPMQHEHMDHSSMHHAHMNHDEMDHLMHEMRHPSAPIQSAPKTVQGWANASTPVGHKALAYADLRALNNQPDNRAPTQNLMIHLGGTMERYIWTLNGKKFNEAEPLNVRYGDRVRLTFVNDSMMAHPMHLHGMFMQLENGTDSISMPNKHTIIVPPGQTVSALLTANEEGEWAIHCHLLYHMTAGMMNKLIVANVEPGADQMPATMPINTAHDHHNHAAHQQHLAAPQTPFKNDKHPHDHGSEMYGSALLDNALLVDEDGKLVWQGALDARIGTDEQKLMLKAHAHRNKNHSSEFDIMALYSRMQSDFWDIQAGIRYQQDEHLSYTAAVVGVHGLAPQFIETDAYFYIGENKRIGFLLELERDFLLTNKLITQPYLDSDWSLHSDIETERRGLTSLSLGIETRYEITQRVRPFVDISYRLHNTDKQNVADRNWLLGAGLTLLF